MARWWSNMTQLREHYKLCLKSKILLSKSCVAQKNKSTAKMHPLISLQLKGGRTDPGWVLAPYLLLWENDLTSVNSTASSHTVIMTLPWKGSCASSGGQGMWGSQVKLLILCSVGEFVCVIGSWGNRGTELRDIPAQACNHPGPMFLLCSRVFWVMLWGALSSAFLLSLFRARKLCAQKGPQTVFQAEF